MLHMYSIIIDSKIAMFVDGTRNTCESLAYSRSQ